MTKRLQGSDVLCYSTQKRGNQTVRRHYSEWRSREGLPERCDIPECMFYKNTLLWNDKPLMLILDHKSGNNTDNSPQNLRYLCPNCNSQQSTLGGRNKGRIQNNNELGYEEAHRDGHRDAKVFPRSLGLSTGLGRETIHTH